MNSFPISWLIVVVSAAVLYFMFRKQPTGIGNPVRNNPALFATVTMGLFCALILYWTYPQVGFSSEERNGIGGWIFEYQTLIAGLAAVIAAAATVVVMNRTDAASERRHSQVLAINTYRDRRLLERARNHSQFLDGYLDSGGISLPPWLENEPADDTSFSVAEIEAFAWLLSSAKRDMLDILLDPKIEQAVPLFSGPTSQFYSGAVSSFTAMEELKATGWESLERMVYKFKGNWFLLKAGLSQAQDFLVHLRSESVE